MAAYNIPLEVKSPNIEPPGQVASQVLNMKDLMLRGQTQQLQQQQLQGQIQDEALRRATVQGINSAVQQNMTVGSDGSFQIDHNGVAKTLATQGLGSAINGYQGDWQKTQREALQNMGMQADNREKLMSQGSQLLQGVKDDDGYQAVVPQLKNIMGSIGLPATSLPDHYDPMKIAPLLAMGQKFSDYNAGLKDAAQIASYRVKGGQEAVKDIRADILNGIAASTSDADLDNERQKARAIVGQLPQEYQAAAAQEIERIPNKWSPDIPFQARMQSAPATSQPKLIEEETMMAGRKLGATRSQADYQATYNQLPAAVRPAFRAPKDWDENAASDALDASRTPEQQARSQDRQAIVDERMQAAKDRTEQMRQASLDRIERAREHDDMTAALGYARVANSPGGRKTEISRMADEAIAHSAAGGGGKIDQAIADVQNQGLYQDNPIGENRGDVVKELQSRQVKANPETRTDRRKGDLSSMADQAIENSAAGGGTSIDEAIADVKNPKMYKDHPIGQNRGQVIGELLKRKGQEATVRGKEAASPAPAVPPRPKAAVPGSTQAKPQQAAPPKAVTDALPAGEHTFRNGQTWRKNPDGSVVFVR